MSSSLFALLSQRSPHLQTRKALILTGLQQDFLSADGKLPVSTTSGFLERLRVLVPAFRDYGEIIWVRSQFEANRVINSLEETGDTVITGPLDTDKDRTPASDRAFSSDQTNDSDALLEPDKQPSTRSYHDGLGSGIEAEAKEKEAAASDKELFLYRTASREPCCVPGTDGANYATQIKDLIAEGDMHVVKTFYSAFGATSLLLTLRSKLVTEIYVCGCITNLSIFATAMDAARYGISVTLVEDCLGYRRRDRHEMAMQRLREDMGAKIRTSNRIIDTLKDPAISEDEINDSDEDDNSFAVQDDAEGEPLYLPSDIDDPDEDDDGIAVGEDAEGQSLYFPPNATSEAWAEYRSPPNVRDLYLSEDTHGTRSATMHDPGGSLQATEAQTGSFRSRRSWDTSSNQLLYSRPESVERHSTVRDHKNAAVKNEEGEDKLIDYETLEASAALSADKNHDSHRDRNYYKQNLPTTTTEETSAVADMLYSSDNPDSIGGVHPMEDALNTSQEDVVAVSSESYEIQTKRHHGEPLLGDGTEEESAGSHIIHELLPAELADTIFDKILEEIPWESMYHQTGAVPRLVCCQGSVDDTEANGTPVYRHPADQTITAKAWTPMVDIVRRAAEVIVGHPLNHALIQLYRGGTDYISEHSDKTLDIAKGSNIVNVSLGAQRTLRLRTKRAAATDTSANSSPSARTTYRVTMPHNSMIVMSLPVNAKYLHGITADKRPACELSEAETAYGGQRISLTFRHIGTFLSDDSKLIWGQGATGKTREEARPVINGDQAASEKIIKAFGAENQASSIDWEIIYGDGFDVLHIR